MIKSHQSLFTNAFWNLLAVAITAIAGFILVPVIINAIGEENFGIYAIILMVGGFAQLQSLGLGEATLKYVSQYYSRNDIEGVNRVLGATLSVYIFSGFIVSGIIATFAAYIIGWFKLSPENVQDAILALRIAGCSFLVSIFGAAFKTIPEAIQRYDVLSRYTIFIMVIRYSTMYIIAQNGGGIIGLAYLTLIGAIIDIFVYGYLAKVLIPNINRIPNFNKKGIHEVFGYGMYSFINDLIQRASLYIDQFILGLFFNAASIAYLTAPKDIITKAQGLTGAASQALFPRFSSMEVGAEMQKLYITSLWTLTVLSFAIFIPLAIVVPTFLSIWISPEFSTNSSEFARLFSLGIAFNGGVSVYFALLKGTGRVNWLTNIISTLTVLSGFATAILVYNYGIIGSGIRAILFSWVGSLLCIHMGKKIFKDFKFLRVGGEVVIIPFALGIIYYFSFVTVLQNLSISNWIELLMICLLLFLGMIIIQGAANFIIYKEAGSFKAVFERLKISKQYL